MGGDGEEEQKNEEGEGLSGGGGAKESGGYGQFRDSHSLVGHSQDIRHPGTIGRGQTQDRDGQPTTIHRR